MLVEIKKNWVENDRSYTYEGCASVGLYNLLVVNELVGCYLC
jgi:hypothetical protein